MNINFDAKMMELQNEKFLDISDKCKEKSEKETLEAARGFEAIFVKMMFNELNNTLEKGLFGDQPGADFYQGIFFDKIAEKIADSGELGLSKYICKNLRPNEDVKKDNNFIDLKKILNEENISLEGE